MPASGGQRPPQEQRALFNVSVPLTLVLAAFPSHVDAVILP